MTLTEGVDCLLFTYARRTQEPARERRYVLALPNEGDAVDAHRDALVASATAPRAWGETQVEEGAAIAILGLRLTYDISANCIGISKRTSTREKFRGQLAQYWWMSRTCFERLLNISNIRIICGRPPVACPAIPSERC